MDRHDAKSAIESVAEQLASQRAQLGISLDDAAARSNIDAERLDLAENAEVALDEDELTRLAETYGVAITAFFGGRVTPIQYLFGA
jgi:transcriptional regulator with XRE-family HTH domain